jgi:hypothetical protein
MNNYKEKFKKYFSKVCKGRFKNLKTGEEVAIQLNNSANAPADKLTIRHLKKYLKNISIISFYEFANGIMLHEANKNFTLRISEIDLIPDLTRKWQSTHSYKMIEDEDDEVRNSFAIGQYGDAQTYLLASENGVFLSSDDSMSLLDHDLFDYLFDLIDDPQMHLAMAEIYIIYYLDLNNKNAKYEIVESVYE